jgi:murein DD-endopeptidase MepM/ murein hydrolase activator NlpD
MGKTNYYYNRETCQYEPAKLRWSSVLGYLLTLSLIVVLLSIGILVLHSRVYTTTSSKNLRLENMALVQHQASLQADLIEIGTMLKQLKSKETLLHNKLFDEPEAVERTSSSNQKHDLLLANFSQFRAAFKKISKTSNQIALKAAVRNEYFGNTISIDDEEMVKLMALPSLLPVAQSDVTKLYSGYGNRINPFHKGVYFHPGLDFTAPRGTMVMAAGNGKVIHMSKSSIEAGYGNYIDIDHGYGIITRYAHLETMDVRVGQKVTKGERIGTVGSSGGSIAPHLHFEIIRNEQQVDPIDYLMQGITSKEYAALQLISKQKNQSLD